MGPTGGMMEPLGDLSPEAEEQAFRENMEAQINRRLGFIIVNNLDKEGLKKTAKQRL